MPVREQAKVGIWVHWWREGHTGGDIGAEKFNAWIICIMNSLVKHCAIIKIITQDIERKWIYIKASDISYIWLSSHLIPSLNRTGKMWVDMI